MQNHKSKRKSDEEIAMLRCFEFKVESFKNTTIQLVDALTDKKEKALAEQWLEKLFRELLRSGERSADALEYLFFLMCSLQTLEPLEHPFTQPPPDIDSRLIPLHYQLDTFSYTENLRSLKNDLYLDRYMRKEKEAKSRTKTLLEQSMRPTELNMYPTKKDRAAAAAARSAAPKTPSSPDSGAQLTQTHASRVHYGRTSGTLPDSELESKTADVKSTGSGGSKKSKKSKASRKSKGSGKGSGGSKAASESKSQKKPPKSKKPAQIASKKLKPY